MRQGKWHTNVAMETRSSLNSKPGIEYFTFYWISKMASDVVYYMFSFRIIPKEFHVLLAIEQTRLLSFLL